MIEAGLVDELRLLVYPLIAGEGKALFGTTFRRRGLELQKAHQLQDGRLNLIYGIGLRDLPEDTGKRNAVANLSGGMSVD